MGFEAIFGVIFGIFKRNLEPLLGDFGAILGGILGGFGEEF